MNASLRHSLLLIAAFTAPAGVVCGQHNGHGHHAHHGGHHQFQHYGGHHGHHAYYGAPYYYGAGYGYGNASYGYPTYGFGYGHSATYQEGVLRGAAEVIRAQGEFNLNGALAASIAQDAASKKMDNELKRAQTFFAKRSVNQQARAESLADAAARRERIAAAARPDRLGPTQYRPDLGLLNWPALLRRDEFRAVREQLASLIAVGPTALANHGGEIRELASQLREQMKPMFREVDRTEYRVAYLFLDSLQYEAQLALRGEVWPSLEAMAAK
ncbi:MAG: hypothetical protein KDB14_27190 [Planctomycetales bacterium]|nr:hypothetical protein [Planctomycetales bacterium]